MRVLLSFLLLCLSIQIVLGDVRQDKGKRRSPVIGTITIVYHPLPPSGGDGKTSSLANTDEKKTLIAYPNPSVGEFNLILPVSTAALVRVFSVNGQEVFSTMSTGDSEMHVSLGDLPNGIYIINVANSEGIWTKKIQVAH